MLNPDDPDLISLKAARRMFHGIQKLETVRRWCKKGSYHPAMGTYIKLDCVRIGGRLFTSKRAIASFVKALNA